MSKKIKVSSFINHENFNHYLPYADISVLELETQPTANEYVEAAPLPNKDPSFKEHATVVGWGDVNKYGITPDELNELEMKIDSDEHCKDVYESYFDVENSFCAGYRGPSSGKGVCFGDSGGPLFTQRNKSLVLTGVVSRGRSCDGYVDIYTDVFSLRDWINSMIDN